MRNHGFRRIDRETAERLLDGRPIGADTGQDALVDLLAAAAAPPAEGAQAGEQAALAAFREARLGTAPQPQTVAQPRTTHRSRTRRQPMIAPAPARFRSTRAVIAGLAATAALGGVAVAASTGHLPGPWQGSTPVAPRSSGPVPGATGQAGTGSALPDGQKPSALGTAGPALPGLCRAYTTGGGRQAKATADPAFAAVIRAAGGEDRVAGYCSALLASGSGDSGSGAKGKGKGKAKGQSQGSAATHGAKQTHTPASGRNSHAPNPHATATSHGAAATQSTGSSGSGSSPGNRASPDHPPG